MAASLDATVGGGGANSYITLAAANTYFDNHPEFSTWDALSDDQKIRYLIQATRQIDTEPIDGDKYDTSTTSGVPGQALRFPTYRDYIDATLVLPPMVPDACCEQAIVNSKTGGSSTRADLQNQGVKRLKTGDGAEEEYTEGVTASTQLSALPRQMLVNAGLLKTIGQWG